MTQHEENILTQDSVRQPGRTSPIRPAVASLIGTAIEWYDYFIYGMAAAIVFGGAFFPAFSSAAGTLAAFATFSVGFIARPLGGIVMGHFGDRIGRKAMLVSSLILMGTSTVCIGVLPTYESIGVLAPILLVTLRFAQGFGVGGEWGGAVLMAVEHAPKDRRTFYGSFPQMGVPAGLILANLVFLAVSGLVGDEAFAAWAWRIPFLASGVLVIVGIVLRSKLEESPEFERVVQQDARPVVPIVEVLRNHWRTVLLISGSFIAINAVAYVFMAYVLSYATSVHGITRMSLLWLSLAASVVWLAVIPLAAVRADRRSRGRVLVLGSVALVVGSALLFPMIDTASIPVIAVALVLLGIAMGIVYGPMAGLFSSLFPPAVRYTGTSLGYQVGSILGGGFAPTIASGLFVAYGSSVPITAYLVSVSLVSLVCLAILTRTPRMEETNLV